MGFQFFVKNEAACQNPPHSGEKVEGMINQTILLFGTFTTESCENVFVITRNALSPLQYSQAENLLDAPRIQ